MSMISASEREFYDYLFMDLLEEFHDLSASKACNILCNLYNKVEKEEFIALLNKSVSSDTILEIEDRELYLNDHRVDDELFHNLFSNDFSMKEMFEEVPSDKKRFDLYDITNIMTNYLKAKTLK